MKRFILLFVGALLFGHNGFTVALAQVPSDEEGEKAFVRLQDAMQKIRAARFFDYEGRVGAHPIRIGTLVELGTTTARPAAVNGF